MTKLLQIEFKGSKEVLTLIEERRRLLYENSRAAVASAVLYGVRLIAIECPVDSGRARASIAGEYGGTAGVDISGPNVDPGAVSQGQKESSTFFRGLEGRIGSNVEYIIYIEYGHRIPARLTKKQLAYLFASGILDSSNRSRMVHAKINRRAGIRFRVKGKGMFRKNIPEIKKHFHEMMELAVKLTTEGKRMKDYLGLQKT